MAVYRHILVIPLTAKVLLPKNGKPPTAKTIPPCCITAKKNTAIFWFYRVCQKSTANSSYRQKVPPTLNTAKRVSPTLDTADIGYSPKGTADTGYRRKGTAYTLDTAQKVPAFLFVFVLGSVLSGSSGSFSVEPLCGREDRETGACPYTCPWSSRTMSGLDRGESQGY